MNIELANCEAALLAEIADTVFKRKDVAQTYAMALMSSERDKVDWKKVNAAIVERWSVSGLKFIKEAAWKMVEAKRAEHQVPPNTVRRNGTIQLNLLVDSADE